MTEIVLKIVYAIIALVIFWTILFFISPDKMTKFWARLALFFKSAERTARDQEEPPVDRRSGQDRRVSISDFAKTQAPTDVKEIIRQIQESKRKE